MSKKVFKISFIVLFSLLYFFVIFLNAARVHINSDFANLILEAKDFWNGDVLLSNRYFTGITFYTTDLLYYVISFPFFRNDNFTFVLATSLMCFMIAFAGTFLLKVKDKKFPWILFAGYIAFSALPEPDAIAMLRAHTAADVYCLFALYFYNEWRISRQRKFLVITCSLFAIALIGDTSVFILFIMPVLLIQGIEFLRSFCINENKETESVFKKTILMISCAFTISVFFEKIFFLVNGSVKNSFVSALSFITFEELGEHLCIYFTAILDMFNAHFVGKPVLWIPSFFYFFRVIYIFIGFFVIIKSILDIFFKDNYDFISSCISLGFVLISAVFVITILSGSTEQARYFACSPVLFGIVIIRQFQMADFSKISSRAVKFARFFVLLLSFLFCFNYFRKTDFRIAFNKDVREKECYKPERLELARYLEKCNLKNGYSDFWTASIISVYSKGNTTIRPVSGLYIGDDEIEKYKWFSKNSWYKEPAFFFVLSPDGSQLFNIDEKRVLSKFGTPSEYDEFQGFKIFIYDHDIALEK